MRNIYLSILSICLTTIVSAQYIVLDPGTADITGDPSEIAEAHATIKNNGPENQDMTWLRKVNDIPELWESSVCDPNLCWAPFANSPSYGFTLTSGGSGNTYIKFDARNMPTGPAVPGNGHVEINFYSISDSANYNALGVYTANLDGVGFHSPNAENSFTVYPNPAVSDVNLIASYSSNIQKIKIVNIVGKTVYDMNWVTSSGKMLLSVEQFPEGIYFVQFINESNDIVATKKLAVKD
ncbi:MAG: T9SS type A sorting domain-containing protein [Fimbriimonadaceae bacterium]|nr:T9SS type A sorting domain-containing protein [Chitinophagales bacterium]